MKLLDVLQTDTAVIWFAKSQHLGLPTIPIISTIPLNEATAAMLNPVSILSDKPRKRSRADKKQKPLKKLVARAQTSYGKDLTTMTKVFGPVKPRTRLVLPCPQPHIMGRLNQALLHGKAKKFVPKSAIDICFESMYTLRSQAWLDDVVLDAYLEHLQEINPPGCVYEYCSIQSFVTCYLNF